MSNQQAILIVSVFITFIVLIVIYNIQILSLAKNTSTVFVYEACMDKNNEIPAHSIQPPTSKDPVVSGETIREKTAVSGETLRQVSVMPAERLREVTVGTETYMLPEDIRFLLPWPEVILPDSALPAETSRVFRDVVTAVDVECRHRVRAGVMADGGWDVCVAGPYRPKPGCLVYDFGIGGMWGFDEAMVKEFGCEVRAFDPTYVSVAKIPCLLIITSANEVGRRMNQPAHDRTENIHFYPVGLSGHDGVTTVEGRTFPGKTLSTLIRELGDTERQIDYLKIDIEFSEWDALAAMFTDGILQSHVRQIGLEVHGHPLVSRVRILSELSKLGFRKWQHHWNPGASCIYSIGDGYFTQCNEIYYINTNLLKNI